ncbi:MAG: phage tail protein I [Rhizobiaceae bacterium]|nr:phage tail protein I [Rhizobiaceae bacterium]
MAEAVSLLPANSKAFERAFSISVAELRRMPAELILTLWDPWTIPAGFLAVLAWGLHLDYWREWWPEFRKRQVIAESRAFHRLKSTIAADRMACAYADAELISYHLPRDGFAIGRGVTPEAYERWVAGLPEIRVYQLPPRENRFPPLGGAIGRHPFCRGGQMQRARRAELRQGDRIVPLVVSGETTGTDGETLSDIERVSVPKPPAATLAVGRGAFSLPIGKVPSSRRVFSFRWQPTSRDPFDLVPGVPSLIPVEATPRKEGLFRPHRPWRFVVGRTPVTGSFGWPRPDDWYLALRVADGSGPSGVRPRSGAIGRDRLPRERYSKELAVLLTRPARRGFPFSSGRIVPSPDAKVADVLEAIGSAQSLRDRVSVNLNVYRPLTVADLETVTDRTRVGDYRLMTRR